MSYKTEVTPLIRQFVADVFFDYDEFQNTLSKIPRPYFESEEDAYNSLLELVHFIRQSNDSFDRAVRFSCFDIAELYLQEAESYRLFWQLSYPFTYASEQVEARANFQRITVELLTGIIKHQRG